ncbi:MAG: dihydrodipicolinate reductase [Spirochaetales bacterium]|nr:dihydrodipicolinate reductase [Spirochaetales bacterium]
MRKIHILIWGFGAMGSGMARMLMDKEGVEIRGVCDIHPDRVGRGVKEVLNLQCDHPEVVISGDIGEVLKGTYDLALLATDSFTVHAYDKISLLLEHGINVISTAEEMAYPRASEPELAGKMDKLARDRGVTLLGTGINPGMIMDLLVLMLTGASMSVDSIRAERVNSLSPFGPAVMEEQGVGLSPEEFFRGRDSGSLAGHVGFNESVRMIADGLGWMLDGPIRQTMEPIVSAVPRKTPYAEIASGRVAGCRQEGHGFIRGEEKITMIHPQQIEPQLGGIETGDYITIKGVPDINMSIKPEIPGGIGTIAICVNMIPHVLNGRPGLKSMLDLPVPRAVLGDMRNFLDEELK